MDRDSRRARLLRHAGELHAVDAFFVPSLAELDRHGHIDRLHDRFDDARGERQVTHERRAVAVPGDLRGGAAHVDVDDVAAGLFERDFRALRHGFRVMAENLRRGGMLVRRKLKQTGRFLVLIAQRLGRNHFRHGQRRAVFAADAAESKVGHSRHRRKHKPSVNFYRSDLHNLPPRVVYGLFYHNTAVNATCRMVTVHKAREKSRENAEKRSDFSRKVRLVSVAARRKQALSGGTPYLLYIGTLRTKKGDGSLAS